MGPPGRATHQSRSPSHATTVPLALNPSTGAIMPQYHVVFDDWFATIATSTGQIPDFSHPTWADLFGKQFHVFDDDDDNASEVPPAPTLSTRET